MELQTELPQLLQELQQELEAMMAQIAAGPQAGTEGPTLADRLGRIDQIRQDLDGRREPALNMLLHYLERRSYAKAIDFLHGQDETSKPNC